MISYTDEIDHSVPPSAWSEASQRLFESLQTVGQEFGDKVHTSGSVDYLIRTLVNATDITVQERVPNYFLILVSNNGIDTVTRVRDEEQIRAGTLTFQGPWVDEICDRFRAFRRQLG